MLPFWAAPNIPQYDKWSRRSKLSDMVIRSDFHSGHKNASEHLIGVASFAPSRLDRDPATRWFDRSTARGSINCQLPPFSSSEQCFMNILMEMFFGGDETSVCH